MIIAIDGPSGSGKSTVSIEVARRLGLSYLDTGAIYRALTLVDGNLEDVELDISTQANPVRIAVADIDVSQLIRTPEVTGKVSQVAADPAVRAWVGGFIADLKLENAVIEGRDIGSVVAPDAELKIYLTADESVRGQRRAAEWAASSEMAQASLSDRDAVDATRTTAPLQQVADAVMIDSSSLSIKEVVDRIVDLALQRGFNSAHVQEQR